MKDVTTLYDNLVAIRRADQVLPETASRETRNDLDIVIRRIKGKLAHELALLPVNELEEVFDSLDLDYTNEARAELEALM